MNINIISNTFDFVVPRLIAKVSHTSKTYGNCLFSSIISA